MKGLINISNNKNYYFKWYNVSRLNPFLKTKTESQKSFLKKKKKKLSKSFLKNYHENAKFPVSIKRYSNIEDRNSEY